MNRAVVMFTPPHYKVRGVPRLWMGRIDHAIKVACKQRSLLIVAGDANSGHDLDAFVLRAHRSPVPAVLRAFNGHDRALKNTRGDARAIAGVLREIDPDGRITRLTIVTCWYHVPRAWIALRQELGSRRVRISASPVWTKLAHGLRVLPNELRGCWDYLRGNLQQSRGAHIGKPDLERGGS